MICPYCGKHMKSGFIENGKGPLMWTPGNTPKSIAASIFPKLFDRASIQLGVSFPGLGGSSVAYYCPDCQKVILDAADARGSP